MSEIDPFDYTRQLECMSEIDLNDNDESLEVMSEIGSAEFSPAILSRLNPAGGPNSGANDSNGEESGEPSAAFAAAEALTAEPMQMPSILDIAAATACKAARPQYQFGDMPMLKTRNKVLQLAIADRHLVVQPLGYPSASSAPTPPPKSHIDTKGKGKWQRQGKGKEVDRAYNPCPTDENTNLTQTGPFPAMRPEMGHCADNHIIRQILQDAELQPPCEGRQTDCSRAKAKEIDNWLNADNNHYYLSLSSRAPIPTNSSKRSVSVSQFPFPPPPPPEECLTDIF